MNRELREARGRIAELEKRETGRGQIETRSREAEENSGALFDAANDVIIFVDKNGKVLNINEKVAEIIGYQKDQVIGNNVFKLGLFKKENLPQTLTLFRNAVKRGKVETAPGKRVNISDFVLRHKNGDSVFVEANTTIIERNGRLRGFLSVVRDITERRRVEEVMRRSEERFHALTENSSDIILVVDKKGTITYASPSIERSCGYKRNDLIGKSGFDFIAPADLPRAVHDFGKAVLTRETIIPNVFRVRHRDGSERVLEGVGRNLLDNPVVAGFVMNVRDITLRVQAEEALKKSQVKYRELVENLNDAVYATDANGVFTYVSPRIETVSGYESREVIGRPFTDFIFPDDLPFLAKQFKRVMSGHIEPSEYRIMTKNGQIKWVRTSSRPVYEGNRVVGLQGVLTDISERRQAEEGLRKTLKELGMERQQMKELAQKVIEAQEQERRYLAASVHDELLQGLVAVLYFLQSIDVANLDPKTRQRKEALLEIIKSSIDRGRRLIQEIEPIGPTPLNIVHAIRECIDLNFSKSNVKVELVHPKHLPSAGQSVKTNIVRIVQEALINVRKHARATKVLIRITASKGRTHIEIKDDGVGFDRGRVAESAIGHYGLLAMQERANLIGGELSIESGSHQGTIIKGSFPSTAGNTNGQ